MAGIMQMLIAGASGWIFNQTISATTTNYNLRASAVAAGWNQVEPLIANITIAAGVVVGSTSTGAYAFDTGATFPAGSKLSLTLGSGAYIVGMGGAGGTGGKGSDSNGAFSDNSGAGGAGGAGGPALRAQYYLTVTNNGVIGGGGAGGAGGHGGYGMNPCVYVAGSGGGGGGGGAGYAGGSGGVGGAAGIDYYAGNNGYVGGSGGAGSVSSGGAGGSVSVPAYDTCGSPGYAPTSGSAGGGLGNGAAIVGNSFITWAAAGTRLGSIS